MFGKGYGVSDGIYCIYIYIYIYISNKRFIYSYMYIHIYIHTQIYVYIYIFLYSCIFHLVAKRLMLQFSRCGTCHVAGHRMHMAQDFPDLAGSHMAELAQERLVAMGFESDEVEVASNNFSWRLKTLAMICTVKLNGSASVVSADPQTK